MSVSVPLSKVAQVNPSTSTGKLLSTDPVDFFPMAVVDAEKSVARASERRALGQVSKGFTSFQDGDILLAKITPCFENGKITQAAVTTGAAFGSTEFHVVRCGEELDGRYLVHFLRRPQIRADGERKMTGSGGQRRVPRHYLESLDIPLPTLPEQRRIAAILDKADALRTKRRAALAQLDRLAQAIFVEMFGDPVTGPKGCSTMKLSDCVANLEYGPRFHDEAYSADGIRIVRITDLDQSGALDFESMPRMTVNEQTKKRFALQPGDIVFARTGATVGKVALIRDEDPPCIAGAYFIRLRFNDSVLPLYAASVLRAKSVQELIAKQSRQAAQQNFSGPGLRALPLPVPPMPAQLAYVSHVEKLMVERERQSTSLTQMGKLFSSLQHRAFRGEL